MANRMSFAEIERSLRFAHEDVVTQAEYIASESEEVSAETIHDIAQVLREIAASLDLEVNEILSRMANADINEIL